MEKRRILLALGVLLSLVGFIIPISIDISMLSTTMIVLGVILIFVGIGVEEEQLDKIIAFR